jgi:predicted O-methyltransferase YrrM
MVEKQKRTFGLEGRVVLQPVSILEATLQRESVDVVFMDTNHTYDDYNYIMHLLENSVLRRGFLFIVDDPLHTGTDLARKQFIEKHSDSYKVITRTDWNLWWFFEK